MSALNYKFHDHYWPGGDAAHSFLFTLARHFAVGMWTLKEQIWMLSSHPPIPVLPEYMNVRIMPLLVRTAEGQIQLTRAPVEVPDQCPKTCNKNTLSCFPAPAPSLSDHLSLKIAAPGTHTWKGELAGMASSPNTTLLATATLQQLPLPHEPRVNTPKWIRAVWFPSNSQCFPHFSLMSTPYSESEGKKINLIYVFSPPIPKVTYVHYKNLY